MLVHFHRYQIQIHIVLKSLNAIYSSIDKQKTEAKEIKIKKIPTPQRN